MEENGAPIPRDVYRTPLADFAERSGSWPRDGSGESPRGRAAPDEPVGYPAGVTVRNLYALVERLTEEVDDLRRRLAYRDRQIEHLREKLNTKPHQVATVPAPKSLVTGESAQPSPRARS